MRRRVPADSASPFSTELRVLQASRTRQVGYRSLCTVTVDTVPSIGGRHSKPNLCVEHIRTSILNWLQLPRYCINRLSQRGGDRLAFFAEAVPADGRGGRVAAGLVRSALFQRVAHSVAAPGLEAFPVWHELRECCPTLLGPGGWDGDRRRHRRRHGRRHRCCRRLIRGAGMRGGEQATHKTRENA